MPLDPRVTYVHLSADGVARELAGGPAFWSLPQDEMTALGRGWLVSEYDFTADWPTWEMHPSGDEFVYLLSGSVELLVEEPEGPRSIRLAGTGAVVVPKGAWHTVKVHVPSRMLHVTLGAGTQTRPALPPGA